MDRRGLIYTRVELACSLKASAMRRLLADGHETVLHLDGDCLVLGAMDPLIEAARARGVAFTPHSPRRPRGEEEVELTFVNNGVFNTGVVGVGVAGGAFLDWWDERKERHAVFDGPSGLTSDQGWAALAPALFDVAVVRESPVNVMGWNLSEDVQWDGDTPSVGGQPIRCFHLSGHFDPGPPPRFMPGPGIQEPWPPLSERPGTARLCAHYAQLLAAARGGPASYYPYDSLPGGTPVTPTIRAVYRDALLACERGEGPEPPNPFTDGDTEGFMRWLDETDDPRGTISRYLFQVWRGRHDLQTAFPDPDGRDREAFLRWAGEAASRQEIDVPEGLSI